MIYSFVSHHKVAISKTYITVKGTEGRVGTRNTVYIAGIESIMSFFLVLPLKSHCPRYPSSSPLPLGSLFHQHGKLVYDKVHVLRYVQLGIDERRLTYG